MIYGRRFWRLARSTLAALGFLAISGASATELQRLDVSHADGRYEVQADLLITASVEAVYRLLTDYGNLAALNPAITASEVIPAPPPFDVRVKTLIKACVALYCQTLRRVEDVREGDGRLVATIVPGQSDFRSGRAEWLLEARGPDVLVQYRAELEPDFVVPPILGTLLIKQGLERELARMLANLERLARAS